MIVEAETAQSAPVAMAGNPVKLSGFEEASKRPAAPELDADRARILAELAGD
jgi:crotonobetainyl-CoA:carnitine CoA-transferase CaiB-like acyl-CoA transferase